MFLTIGLDGCRFRLQQSCLRKYKGPGVRVLLAIGFRAGVPSLDDRKCQSNGIDVIARREARSLAWRT